MPTTLDDQERAMAWSDDERGGRGRYRGGRRDNGRRGGAYTGEDMRGGAFGYGGDHRGDELGGGDNGGGMRGEEGHGWYPGGQRDQHREGQGYDHEGYGRDDTGYYGGEHRGETSGGRYGAYRSSEARGAYVGGMVRAEDREYGGYGHARRHLRGGEERRLYVGRRGPGGGTGYGERGRGRAYWRQEPSGYGGLYDEPNRDEPAGRAVWGDRRDQGPYAGRGPRGWRRSNERIRDDVAEGLTDHGGVDASDIEVDVDDGVVTLRGRVADRRQKRLAEDVADRVSGVEDVRNELRLERSEERQDVQGG